jgi:hypothetical protein
MGMTLFLPACSKRENAQAKTAESAPEKAREEAAPQKRADARVRAKPERAHE